MKKTGIFFVPLSGRRLRGFPQALEGILNQPNVSYYEAFHELRPTTDELLCRVHTQRMIEEVKGTPYYETALFSTGGTVQASELIRQGEIDNAFVFTGTGDHHAGRDWFGGGCHFNGAALAIRNLRDISPLRRFAILDTDSHHGDGTRDIFQNDDDVLHVCFCSDSVDLGTNVDISVPAVVSDSQYLDILVTEFLPRVREFKPEMIFWEFGFDTTQGDYGSRGLTPDCHHQIASIVKQAAEISCQGRMVAILCGGSRRRIATASIPKVISCLAELKSV